MELSWEKAKFQIKKSIPEHSYRMWIEPLALIDCDVAGITLGTPNDFFIKRIKENYLDIFKIRMGDRLAYEIQDHTEGICIPFPPLIIQPLVENAIKYAIEPGVEGGKIFIECKMENQRLYITVTDTGNGIDLVLDKAGIGINNVSLRLEAIYGNRAALTLTTNSPQGLAACIEVPL